MRRALKVAIALILVGVFGAGAYMFYSFYSFFKVINTSAKASSSEFYNGLQTISIAELNRQEFAPREPIEPREPREKQVGENLTILVVGVDSGNIGSQGKESFRSGVGRTDTIMLFSINRNTRQISLLSVPRDSYVNIPGHGMDKVNHAHAFGGMGLSVTTLSKFLDIPINNYVKFSYDAFVKAVDTLGGVNVNVQENVTSFIDGEVKIPKGSYHMDGVLAFDYVHFRDWDIPRISRQQDFVKALAAQHLGISAITKIPEVLKNISGDIETDLTPKEILDLGLEMRQMNTDTILAQTVPGKPETIRGVSYWVPDVQGTQEAIDEIFR